MFNSKYAELWDFVCLGLIGIISILITIVFIFWFVYLLDVLRRKRICYRKALKCLQFREFDSRQQILAYDTETEYIKSRFLFFLNLIEWFAFIFARFGYMIDFTLEIYYEDHFNSSGSTVYKAYFLIPGKSRNFLSPGYILNILANNCLVLGLILIASLCTYLSARYALKSWIRTNSIPYLISLFLIYLITIQIISIFCSISIIANWFSCLLITISLGIALKQYKKLCMVINWSIVDLRVSQNIVLLEKQIKTKRNFTRIYSIVWLGILFINVSEYIGVILHTSVILLSHKNEFTLSLCEISAFPDHFSDTIFILLLSKFAVGLTGAVCLFIPYIGYGLTTMSVLLWRLVKGKTGYKTHFHNTTEPFLN